MSYKINQIIKKTLRAWQKTIGKLRGNFITAYWWDDRVNFGDLITPDLLKSYGLTPQHQGPSEASLVSTGSILQRLPQSFDGIVLGSGLIQEKPVPLPKARILAVRGDLSRDCSSAPKGVALGDPGLLAYRLLANPPRKSYRIGLIPHYVDKDNPVLSQWLNTHASCTLLIDVERQPKAVIADIARCEYIASSSLHGVIVAHALGIPALWLKISDQLKGGDFKFRDYVSALDMPLAKLELEQKLTTACIIATATLPDTATLKARQKALDELFQGIAREFSR